MNTATTPDTLTINWAGGCACPIRWGAFKFGAPSEPTPPDPWREIDAGVRAASKLLGGES